MAIELPYQGSILVELSHIHFGIDPPNPLEMVAKAPKGMKFSALNIQAEKVKGVMHTV